MKGWLPWKRRNKVYIDHIDLKSPLVSIVPQRVLPRIQEQVQETVQQTKKKIQQLGLEKPSQGVLDPSHPSYTCIVLMLRTWNERSYQTIKKKIKTNQGAMDSNNPSYSYIQNMLKRLKEKQDLQQQRRRSSLSPVDNGFNLDDILQEFAGPR